jgi:hypothetical protein
MDSWKYIIVNDDWAQNTMLGWIFSLNIQVIGYHKQRIIDQILNFTMSWNKKYVHETKVIDNANGNRLGNTEIVRSIKNQWTLPFPRSYILRWSG